MCELYNHVYVICLKKSVNQICENFPKTVYHFVNFYNLYTYSPRLTLLTVYTLLYFYWFT
jgi:hypothetical protein